GNPPSSAASQKPTSKASDSTRLRIRGAVRLAAGIQRPPDVIIGRFNRRCHPGTRPNQSLVLARDRGVANAIVSVVDSERISPGLDPPTKALLDQRDCDFTPHVQVISVGSSLTIKSSDSTLHTAQGHLYPPDVSFPYDLENGTLPQFEGVVF